MSEQEVRPDALIEEMRQIDAQEFEELVADLWEYLGYNTEVTQASADKGVDVTATREFPYDEKILIQAKRYSSTLSGPELREYVALTKQDGVDSVIVVSTSGFTSQAEEEAKRYNLKLVDGESLADLILREDAVDLIRQYVGEIDSADIEQKRSPEKRFSSEKEIQTTVGEGEYLTIELAGYGHEDIKVGTRGRYDTYEFTVICLYIRNKTSSSRDFWTDSGQSLRSFAVTSKEGFAYDSPLKCRRGEGTISPWSNGYRQELSPDSKSRIALFYKGKFVPEKLEWSGCEEGITILINDSVRDEINSIPDSLSLDDLYLYG